MNNDISDNWPFGFGYCCCGCGRETGIAKRTTTSKGRIKGQQLRYIYGHHKTHKIDPAQRFWAKVDKSIIPDGCWPWTGGTTVAGYGVFYPTKGHPIGAHRYVWILTHGSIAKKMQACHHCDNPSCCNPSHLFLGTPSENARDMVKKGRHSGIIPKPTYGEANYNCRLTTQQVQNIRDLYRSGNWTQKRLADLFKVHKQTIQSITSGKSRQHG